MIKGREQILLGTEFRGSVNNQKEAEEDMQFLKAL